jgi:hypothetical protein
MPYDQLDVLSWARHRAGQEVFLCDSHFMTEFGFSAEEAQAMLQALRMRGDIDFRTVRLLARADEVTFTRIRLTRQGLHRLQLFQSMRGGDRRIVHWLPHR